MSEEYIIKKIIDCVQRAGWPRSKLVKIIDEFESDIRQNCMTEINALPDCVYKGNILAGEKSSYEIHKAIIKK